MNTDTSDNNAMGISYDAYITHMTSHKSVAMWQKTLLYTGQWKVIQINVFDITEFVQMIEQPLVLLK